MYFVLLIHRSPEAYGDKSEAEYAAVVERYEEFVRKQTASSRFISAVRLHEPRKTTVVRKSAAASQALISDGPFAETKELLAGLFVLDCESAEQAVALAKSLPAAQDGGAVEIRPVFDLPGAIRGQ